jgi:hypothetical protein
MMSSKLSHGAALGLIGSLLGCGRVQLEPQQASAPGTSTAIARSDGVTVGADAQAWNGAPWVATKLTPILVDIINQSAEPVHGSVADIQLVTEHEQMAALPPAAIDLEPQSTTVGKTAADFDSRAGAYEYRQKNPAELALDRDIQRMAFPEGFIPSGHRAVGFVYFGPLPDDTDGATLHVVLRDAPAGPVHATLDIPFTAR